MNYVTLHTVCFLVYKTSFLGDSDGVKWCLIQSIEEFLDPNRCGAVTEY